MSGAALDQRRGQIRQTLRENEAERVRLVAAQRILQTLARQLHPDSEPRAAWACQVSGCDRQNKAAKGYCWLHYRRWRQHGDPTFTPPPFVPPACSVADCPALATARGFCSTHDSRRRHGLALDAPRRGPSICRVAWCEHESLAHGLCNMHYHRDLRGLPLEPRELGGSARRPGPVKRCTTPDCARPAYGARFCRAHYERERRAASAAGSPPDDT